MTLFCRTVRSTPAVAELLWRWLKARLDEPHTNISHQVMPTWEAHCAFVSAQPYRSWWILYAESEPVGSMYLTWRNEVGVFIEKPHRRQGYAREALTWLHENMEPDPTIEPCCFVANIAPCNKASFALFSSFGYRYRQQVLVKEGRDGNH